MPQDILQAKMRRDIEKVVDEFRGVVGLHMIDLNRERRLDIRGRLQLAAGSSIKVPVLMQLFSLAAQEELDLDSEITVNPEDIVSGSGVLQHLEGSFGLSLRNLAILMINVSDNVATNICIRKAGMQQVNDLMKRLDCPDTELQREMIDWTAVAEGRENRSTARDMARWLQILHQGRLIDSDTSEAVMQVLGKPKSSPISEAVPPDIPVAGKTGGLEGVRCEVARVSLPRRPYVLAVMSAYGMDGDNSAVITRLSRIVWDYMSTVDRFTEDGRGLPEEYLPGRGDI